jgi:acyl-CoA synthetase (AMP-forming)/AMP-acid ligase II
MLSSKNECRKYDLSSVRFLYTGAAPTGKETAEELLRQYPNWTVGQGYGAPPTFRPVYHGCLLTWPCVCIAGMTETATVVVSTSEIDSVQGTSGSLVPGIRAKILDPEGKEITAYNTPGELLVQGPAVTLGYLHNERATSDAFIYDEDGRWIKTGDEVIVVKSPQGNEHFAIVDRLKELIKVKVRTRRPVILVSCQTTQDRLS